MANSLPPKPRAKPLLGTQYDQWVRSGEIRDDAMQREVLAVLESLCDGLAAKSASLGRLFKKKPAAHKGVYLWGGVGRGKSMLMDLFYDAAPVENKRHVHFHAFMQEVHGRIHGIRKEGQRGHAHIKGGGGDPVAALARKIAAETSLLCFDELQATDVADATLLHRLFSGLFEAGVTIVSTSNHPPKSLYTGGHQRERFGKFIALIEEHMQVVALSSPTDYRHAQMRALRQSYVWPLGAAADAFVADALQRLCVNAAPEKAKISVKGRDVHFTAYDRSIGKFTFAELCGAALGPADYLEFARALDTVILTGIPKLPPERRNEAKRFVTLIDALYEHGVLLLATAAAPPEDIYNEGDGAFEFRRTVSRLKEMQSEKWLTG